MSEKKKENLEAKVVEEKKEKKSKFNEKELDVMAKTTFSHTKVNQLFSVDDGQFFFKKSDAQLYARTKKLKVKAHSRK